MFYNIERKIYMVTHEEINSYKIPGLKALDKKQLGFFVDIQNGTNKIEAYVKNYGRQEDKHLSYDTLNKLAHEKTQTKWFKGYEKYYQDVKRHEDIMNTSWTLEMSIQERRKLYQLNLLEVDRLAGAYQKELEYYTRKKMEAIEADDEKEIEKWENRIIKATKAHNMSMASNNACAQALEGLDKLNGLQTMNLNHSGNINFFGEDMWEDDEDEEQEQTD